MTYTPDSVLDTIPERIRLIKEHEGFEQNWYRDPVGVWTIGYDVTEDVPGITRESVLGPISEEQGDRLLRKTLARVYEPHIEEAVTVDLTPGQFSALASFVWNVGVPSGDKEIGQSLFWSKGPSDG